MNPNQPYDPRQNPNQPTQPVQQPEIYNSPSLTNMPYGAASAPQSEQAINDPELDGASSKKKFIIIGIVLGVVVLLLIIAVIIASSSKKSDEGTQQQAQTDDSQIQALQPAQSIEVEQTSNSLSQDLSRVDNEKDFPSASLDDSTLGL